MSPRARRLLLGLGLSLALAPALPACGGSSSGLRVDVDMAGYQATLGTLEIVFSAAPGGFTAADPQDLGNVLLRVEDRNGDQVPDLAMRFLPGAFAAKPTLSFRIETGNRAELAVHAAALGYDATPELKAGADGDVTLPAGGEATLALRLEARSGMVIPGAGTVRLGESGSANVTLLGPHRDAQVSSVAVCDVDGDDFRDIVLGVSGASPSAAVGVTGGVYVVFGKAGGLPSMVTLGSPPAGVREFHVYGTASGDQAGAAVACADLDGDSADDVIIGAPGAEQGAGAVYVIQGRAALPNTVFDLSKTAPAAGAPDATLVGPAAMAHFGSVLYTANLDNSSEGSFELLVAMPGTPNMPAVPKAVHLFNGVLATSGGWRGRNVVGGAMPAQVTFTGIAAASLGAGDVDGDGVALDIIVGDPSYQKSGETFQRGAVYVFSAVNPSPGPTGGGTFGPADADSILEGDMNSQLGAAVVALDTQASGLGRQDLVAGAPGAGAGAGAVRIYTGDTQFFVTKMREPNRTLAGAVAGGRYGSALAGVTTVAGTRLYVGAPSVTDQGKTNAGAAYVYRGDASGPTLLEQIFGAVAEARLGAALAGGAVGGPGSIPDAVLVAPGAPAAETGAGVAYVRYGN